MIIMVQNSLNSATGILNNKVNVKRLLKGKLLAYIHK